MSENVPPDTETEPSSAVVPFGSGHPRSSTIGGGSSSTAVGSHPRIDQNPNPLNVNERQFLENPVNPNSMLAAIQGSHHLVVQSPANRINALRAYGRNPHFQSLIREATVSQWVGSDQTLPFTLLAQTSNPSSHTLPSDKGKGIAASASGSVSGFHVLICVSATKFARGKTIEYLIEEFDKHATVMGVVLSNMAYGLVDTSGIKCPIYSDSFMWAAEGDLCGDLAHKASHVLVIANEDFFGEMLGGLTGNLISRIAIRAFGKTVIATEIPTDIGVYSPVQVNVQKLAGSGYLVRQLDSFKDAENLVEWVIGGVLNRIG